ncbi:hypothetical protein MTP10_01570 [Nonomuraea sp. 3-1Str]|uniref:hypothetical protein n=1 Tax=Nonomuraea sp. 3-1Str TaxID=2929801 RepID=UPI0028584A40|nr:hypothetical protein [Nonomuraea sp. 3-1Str]MDR8407427.1 hypothetical protein [Nonomuraea sp. 3-1Str]
MSCPRAAIPSPAALRSRPEALDEARAGWEGEGRTVVLVAADGTALGALALADAVKPSAA